MKTVATQFEKKRDHSSFARSTGIFIIVFAPTTISIKYSSDHLFRLLFFAFSSIEPFESSTHTQQLRSNSKLHLFEQSFHSLSSVLSLYILYHSNSNLSYIHSSGWLFFCCWHFTDSFILSMLFDTILDYKSKPVKLACW